MKNNKSIPILAIIGDNFISNSLYEYYRRYGKFKLKLYNNISSVKEKIDYIIDSSFNDRTQNMSLTFARVNKLEKILLLNHWERKNLPSMDTIILQAVVYDIYGIEHTSFHRPGAGNNYETDINYCTLISESIRRIHEANIGGVPNVYIPYGENKIKYSHVENIYDPINYMLTNIKKNSTYAIYDEEKYVSFIIDTIQKVLEYQGEIIITNNNSIYTQMVNSLEYKNKRHDFENNIRRIYKYLKYNNPRFINY